MEGDFSTALILLAVGMITVFAVLFLVVLLGNILIRIVNRFHKDIPQVINEVPTTVGAGKLAAIVAAVEVVTSGRGQVTSIEKLKDKNEF